MSGIVQNNILRTSGSIAVAAAGLNWSDTIITGSTVTVEAGFGYWINTTSNTCTITLPSSAEKGDQIVLIDYARTWGTNSIFIDSNGLNYQGNSDVFEVEYTTDGQSVNIVYSDATKGWVPLEDDEVADAPVAPATQRAIFGFGYSGSFTGITNLVNSSGVVQADVSAVGTARRQLAATNFGGDKAIFFGGVVSPGGNANASRISNIVNNSGVVQSDVANASGSVTVKYQTAMMTYGSTGQAFSGFGTNSSEANINLSNLITNVGVIGNDVSGVAGATARTGAGGAPYGGDKGIVVYGYPDPSTNLSNKISNTGVVATDTTGVGTARSSPGAAGYGRDKAIFAHGEQSNHVNLVSNTGVVASDTTASGSARSIGAGSAYGGDKAIFYGGNASGALINYANLVTNLGVVGANQSAVGTARSNLAGATYSYST